MFLKGAGTFHSLISNAGGSVSPHPGQGVVLSNFLIDVLVSVNWPSMVI